MRSFIILLVAIAGISASPALQRGIVDTLMNAVSPVLSNVQSIAGGLVDQFTAVLGQLYNQGLVVLALATPVVYQLIGDLTAHATDAVPLLTSAVAQLTSLIGFGKRGVFDSITTLIAPTLQTVSAVASGLVDQFWAVVNQIKEAGFLVIAQATPVFFQLIADLSAHATDAVPLLTSAVAQLTSLVGKRGIFDSISTLIAPALSTASAVAGGLVTQFTAILDQIKQAGLLAMAQAAPVVLQLFNDLTAHATDAVPLLTSAIAQLTSVISIGKRGVIDSISSLFAPTLQSVSAVASGLVDQFLAVLNQIKEAGFLVIAQATPVFFQLLADLQAHATDAVPLLTSAVAQLTSLVGK